MKLLKAFAELGSTSIQRRILGTKRPRIKVRKVEAVDPNDLKNRPVEERISILRKEIGMRREVVPVYFSSCFGHLKQISEKEVAEYREHGGMVIEATKTIWVLDV